jgi:hypothetical protein
LNSNINANHLLINPTFIPYLHHTPLLIKKGPLLTNLQCFMKLKMITNIFRIFDPTISKYFSLNWLRLLIIFILSPFPLWIHQSRYQILFSILINTLYNEFKILIKYFQSSLIILISLFFIILTNNFFEIYSPTSLPHQDIWDFVFPFLYQYELI